MAQGMSRHRAARAPIGGVALLVVAGAAAVLLVGGSRSIEEVDECLELRRTIETCFGARAAFRKLGCESGCGSNYELWNNAHTASLADYGLEEGPGVLYHPSVEP